MGKHVNDDMKIANILPPLFVCINMATIWSVYICLHLMPMLQVGIPAQWRDEVVAGRALRQAIVSQVLTSLVLVCFCRAILTNPGAVPDTPLWRMGGGQETGNNMPATREVKITGERRHCKWCLKYKPDRCHHCRICKSCVLKMDHHCPWIMNCVGWGNHKYFFLLVVYAVLVCWYIVATVLESVQGSVTKDMPHFNRFLLVLCLMLSVIMGGLMSVFLGFHTWLMFKGMTTIEYCEKTSMEGAGMTFRGSLYDQGLYDNVKAVLGPRVFLWWLPLDPPQGDGVTHTIMDSLEATRTGPGPATFHNN